MTDLEMTRLCAEAMELREVSVHGLSVWFYDKGNDTVERYKPLHDDAQAMALVKQIQATVTVMDGEWRVEPDSNPMGVVGVSADLNRAIVECVAKMQAAKCEA